MIHLMPAGGLCNRLRVIESGVRLAKECGQKLKVYWMIVKGAMNVFSDELFAIDAPNVSVHEMDHYEWLPRVCFSRLNPLRYLHEESDAFVRKVKSGHGAWHVNWASFYATEECDYSWLKPNEKILNQVESIIPCIGEDPIGVHIRRTDNEWSKENSPLLLFVKAMDTAIDANAQQRFFLATDDADTKQRLLARYGDRLFTRQNLAERHDRNGVADGFIDLLLLSRCKEIYGSFGSSFSVEASRIGRIPLSILSLNAGNVHDERQNWNISRGM